MKILKVVRRLHGEYVIEMARINTEVARVQNCAFSNLKLQLSLHVLTR